MTSTEDLEDTFSAMVISLSDRVKEMKALMVMRTPGGQTADPADSRADSYGSWTTDLEEIAARIHSIEQQMHQLREIIQVEKAELAQAAVSSLMKFITEKVKEFKKKVQKQREQIDYMQANLPPRLPGMQMAIAEATKNIDIKQHLEKENQ